MSNTDLPLIPPLGRSSPEVCNVVRLYLAIKHELSAHQIQELNAHLQVCPACTLEYRLMKRTTQLIAQLDSSTPSPRVDQAVRDAIAKRCSANTGRISKPLRLPPPPERKLVALKKRGGMSRKVAVLIAAAAVILLAISGPLYAHLTQPSFALPASVSWSAYVLHYTQTHMDDQGVPKTVEAYHSLADDRMNVETRMGGKQDVKLDVVMIADADHKSVVMDMMHSHFVQSGAESLKWDTDNWNNNKWMFDLTKLRSDIQANRASYLGSGTFQGEKVYQVRYPNGDVLLLDMSYKPVNVLQGGIHGKPLYDDTLQWLSPTKVRADLWNMTPPAGFTPGNMPDN